ncbi:hypothetical protein MLD38_008140 [Melastoma candidum]|uniref:Uncharacterized protein n=1 Tax=Melastoma candidum TaxID=119954 RepID=A0ACB9RSH8_9MYRT|nr:hypothetical protein MLD38_008140 [Melastoma candidum]
MLFAAASSLGRTTGSHRFGYLSRSCLSSLSLTLDADQRATWNTNHPFVLSNPILSLLERCTSFHQLRQVQSQIVTSGLASDPLALSRLVAFCAISPCRDLDYCTRLLYHTEKAKVKAFSWNVTIRGFVESGDEEGAILVYRRMVADGGCRPDGYTYPLLLKCCVNLGSTDLGDEILGHVVKLGFAEDLFVCNAVIHVLVSWGRLQNARKMFDECSVRDLVSWNSLINGYVKCGLVEEALRLFGDMVNEGVQPDEVTMIAMVSACGIAENLELGRKFHSSVKENGLNLTVRLANALMDMYVKCGKLEMAREIFDNMDIKSAVSWTTMVVGHAKFASLDVARGYFDQMPQKDVITWNALISGYVQAKRSKDALELFHEMQANGVKPDEVTMVSCLSACSQLGAHDVGIWIHQSIKTHGLTLNVALGTALVDMYGKCGNIGRALQVFREMQTRNSLTWTAIICGLALHGYAKEATEFFADMIDSGLKPDDVTFLGVITACCHGGLVETGRRCFSQMTSGYNLSPGPKHYSCMVDLLGRAGFLEEAVALIESMPVEADAAVWGPLFFACRVHKNVELGERVAAELLSLDPSDSGNYVLLANLYGEANMWEESRKVRKLMEKRGVEKTPGCSSIEVNGSVTEFTVRDKSHPETRQIHECLNMLMKQLPLVKDLF